MDIQKNTQTYDREKVSKMLMVLFSHWGLGTEEQLILLGMTKGDRDTLARYCEEWTLPNDRDKLERAGILLEIHKSLRLLFPNNRELAYDWMSQPNQAFEGITPVQQIDKLGMQGMYMVRAYLRHQIEG
ncbi:hypothetical protein T9A_00849 [Alcanivorax jadensis T9]|uniref:Antitoxin Xre/MbcA/ParS-like toxin-binding domain-containing protein n=1 Tax=Alcanivorax jadensis T9 TaxID=1177181 RepID=A0ABR4WGU6_9GAMM|nr:MbcA/ParS/Xre antitoxin family protein [Alcanivorax jadensis]KGD62558.1 hypothetical protein T9A_00849 [Alcanivorax jadensis T9]